MRATQHLARAVLEALTQFPCVSLQLFAHYLYVGLQAKSEEDIERREICSMYNRLQANV
jgi:hypothetical protein